MIDGESHWRDHRLRCDLSTRVLHRLLCGPLPLLLLLLQGLLWLRLMLLRLSLLPLLLLQLLRLGRIGTKWKRKRQ